MAKTYQINEIFFSLQGEGVRAGTPNVFIRLSGCNLRCSGEMKEGVLQPVCDTEFISGRKCTLEETALWAGKQVGIALGTLDSLRIVRDGLAESSFWEEPWIVVTGGEPALQVDQEFCDFWHQRGVRLAIETNGTIELPYDTVPEYRPEPQRRYTTGKKYLLDWITVSPKTAEHTLKQLWANEVKYVRGYGQGIPKTSITAEHCLLSPHFEADQVHPETVRWCQKLCLEHPQWRLSTQLHKAWRMR